MTTRDQRARLRRLQLEATAHGPCRSQDLVAIPAPERLGLHRPTLHRADCSSSASGDVYVLEIKLDAGLFGPNSTGLSTSPYVEKVDGSRLVRCRAPAATPETRRAVLSPGVRS